MHLVAMLTPYSWYHMDLDLPLAGVTAWEDEVPLPVDNDNNHIVMTYFSAIVALCQITSRIHDAVFGGMCVNGFCVHY